MVRRGGLLPAMAKGPLRRKSANNKGRNHTGCAEKPAKFPRVSREGIFRLLTFAGFAVIMAVLVSPTLTVPYNWPTAVDYGTPQVPRFAARDFIAEIEFASEDITRTEEARADAASKALPVCAFDGEALRNALLELDKFLALIKESAQKEALSLEEKIGVLKLRSVVPYIISEEGASIWVRSAAAEQGSRNTVGGTPVGRRSKAGKNGAGQSGGRLVPPFYDLAQNVKSLLQSVLEDGVIDKGLVKEFNQRNGERRQVELVNLRADLKQKVVDVASLREVREASAEVRRRASALYPDEKLGAAVGEVASQFVTVTIVPDKERTEKARQQAAEKIEPVKKVVRPGQLIISRGFPWTAQARREMEDYRKALDRAQGLQRRVRGSVGHAILLVLLVAGVARSLALVAPSVYLSLRHVTLVLFSITLMVAIAKLLSLVKFSGYLVPAASVPILLAVLMGRRVGLPAGAAVAILVSMVYGNDWSILVTVTAGSLIGVLAVATVRKRSDLMRPGVIVLGVNIAVVLALGFINDTVRFSPEGLSNIAYACANGVLVMLIVPGSLSLFESAFRITTDIQLLELSDLNHPILRRMTMEAPGTHHHSLMVGNLAEIAAEAIGANSLMARVCSYYHDIGKVSRPEYFSENQTGYNRHDGLSPIMSSRIIVGHVKDGVEMAREYGLCQPVIDIIQQHHGTDMVRFFYEKALKGDKYDCLREEDFRYPGPKPQTREAAIVMVADSIESASRSLTSPTRSRLEAVADKIINTRFADGQFDDCDLTLKDLHVIAETIVRVLVSAYHRRVEYPEQESPKLVATSRVSSSN